MKLRLVSAMLLGALAVVGLGAFAGSQPIEVITSTANLTSTTVDAHVVVNPQSGVSAPIDTYLYYGSSPAPTINETLLGEMGSLQNSTYSYKIKGLAYSTTYYIRACSSSLSSKVTVCSSDVVITTLPAPHQGNGWHGYGVPIAYHTPPVAKYVHATNVTATTAHFVGMMSTVGCVAQARFEFGPAQQSLFADSAFPLHSSFTIVPLTFGIPVQTDAFNLKPGTTYRVRIFARNCSGAVVSYPFTFTTAGSTTNSQQFAGNGSGSVANNNVPVTESDSSNLDTTDGETDTSDEALISNENNTTTYSSITGDTGNALTGTFFFGPTTLGDGDEVITFQGDQSPTILNQRDTDMVALSEKIRAESGLSTNSNATPIVSQKLANLTTDQTQKVVLWILVIIAIIGLVYGLGKRTAK